MSKRPEELRFLLVEARKDPQMIAHELGCLARAGRVSPEQFVVLDCLKETPGPHSVNGFDAVFIGGTGDFSVARNRPDFYEPLLEMTLFMLDQNVPVMGLCYGFHLMAAAVGGTVVTCPEQGETGTCEVQLTEAGRQDAILGALPERFPAQQGHHDVVTSLPEPYVCLAASERCRHQAFRHPDKPYYGLQFHPELSRDDFMLRMQIYSESYASTPELFAKIDAQVQETHNQDVIRHFLEKVVLGG